MFDSEFDGQYIMYRDSSKQAHAGFVVGQSEDGETLYVQADLEVMDLPDDDLEWHWTIKRDALPMAQLVEL